MNKETFDLLQDKNTNYDDIINIINKNHFISNDIEEMINFLSFQNKYDFANKLYNDYRNDLEKNNYIASMVCHFIILIGQEDYEELELVKEEYLNAPYVSQEVEEFLNSIDDNIEQLIKVIKNNKLLTSDEIDINQTKKLLSSKDANNVYIGLYQANKLKEKDGIDMTSFIYKICQNTTEYSLIFAYLVDFLICEHYSCQLRVNKLGEDIIINTSDYFDTYEHKQQEYSDLLDKLEGIAKDIGIYQAFYDLARKAFYWIIPEYIKDFDSVQFAKAIYEKITTYFDFGDNSFEDPVLDYLNEQTKNKINQYSEFIDEIIKEVLISDYGNESDSKVSS